MHMRMQQRGRGGDSKNSAVNWDVFASSLPTGRGPAAQARRAELFDTVDDNGRGYVSYAELEPVLVQVLAPALHSTGIGERRRKVRAAFEAARAAAASVTRRKPGAQDQLEVGEFRMLLVYLERYVELWDYFIAQNNTRDHRITMGEFVAAVPKLRQWGIQDIDAIEMNPRQVFRQIDKDNVGFILFHDFADWCARQDLAMYHERLGGVQPQSALGDFQDRSNAELFDQVDTNKDGIVSQQEFSNAFQDGVFRNSPAASPMARTFQDQTLRLTSPQVSPMRRLNSPQLSPQEPGQIQVLQSTVDQLSHSIQHLQQAMVGMVDVGIAQASSPAYQKATPTSKQISSPMMEKVMSSPKIGSTKPQAKLQKARDEAKARARSATPVKSARVSLFSKLDLDGDGMITREELNKAISLGLLDKQSLQGDRGGIGRNSDANSEASSVGTWNPQDRPGPLIRAILAEDEAESLGLLSLETCPEMNVRDRDFRTTLQLAASRGLVEVCAALLENTFFVKADAKDTCGWTALHSAAMCGNAEVCKVLLDCDRFGEANAKDRIEDTALHAAATRGHAAVCDVLLDHPRFSKANSVNRNGWTPLHCAASGGHTRTSQAILGHRRFQAAAIRNMFGGTALHCAARNGHGEACRALLDHGKFAEAARLKDCVGRTALHWAAQNDHVEACLALIMHPSFTEVDVKDRHGRSALDLAKGEAKEAFLEARYAVQKSGQAR